MSNKGIKAEFKLSLLHPRYFLTWLGVGALYILVWLPYPVIALLGKWLGLLAMKIMKRRVIIARRNLELCFPDMPKEEKEKLLRENFISTGLAIFETGMAWFWPDWRIRRISEFIGQEYFLDAINKKQGAIILGIHFLTLELGGRIIGLITPGIGVYRANDNPVIDYIQTKGRLKSNKYMLDRKNVKGMIRELQEGSFVWYAPDHDYGPKNSIFAPFFAVENTATTIGTSILIKKADPLIIPFIPLRENGKYKVIATAPLKDYPKDDAVAIATFMNKVIEEKILIAPEQYMWLHRRFKTRPQGEKSLY